MIYFRCTQKLLKEISIKSYDYIDSQNSLNSWYCDIFRVDRHKCLLLTNEKTLYSIFVPKVKKNDLRNFNNLFYTNLMFNLQFEKIEINIIEKFFKFSDDIEFTKTKNRSVLGSMNDFKFQIPFRIERQGGIHNLNLLELNYVLNRIPMGSLKYKYPIDKFFEELE
jgi:hypothetical protein